MIAGGCRSRVGPEPLVHMAPDCRGGTYVMNKPIARLIPLLARSVAPAMIIASSMFAPVALGGHGDLDPDFADSAAWGRFDLEGPAWSLESLDNDDILLAGGDFEYICDAPDCFAHPVIGYDATNFVSRFSDTGSIDLSLNAARLEHTQVFDVIPQPDGKLVAVGRRVSTTSRTSQLIVFRLQPNGPLDTTFGNAGIVEFSIARITASCTWARRSTWTPVGASSLPDHGSMSWSFCVCSPMAHSTTRSAHPASLSAPRTTFPTQRGSSLSMLTPVSCGGRRWLSGHNPKRTGCHVVALTAGGALNNAFGTAGIADVDPPWESAYSCGSMVAQPDGRLLVAGGAGEQGFVTRLLTSGSRDSNFSTNAVAGNIDECDRLGLGRQRLGYRRR